MTHLLWTGGWDSTYRLLHLTFVQGRTVQPHYVVELTRPSVPFELRAIDKIRRMVVERTGDASLVRPLLITSEGDIPADETLTASHKALRKRLHLGGQLGWLCRYVATRTIDGLELSIHRDDTAHAFVGSFVESVTIEGEAVWVLRESTDDVDVRRVFGRFRFPLLELTKEAMGDSARRHGFLDIMWHTWFCNMPRSGRPCGRCNPCIYAISKGVGNRVPRVNRVAGAVERRIDVATRPARRFMHRIRRGIARRVGLI